MSKASATTKSLKLVNASAKHVHLAPRKMRLVTNAVKNLSVADALIQLQHMNKKGAPMVIKLLKSAVANAQHNFSIAPDHLFIRSITTDQSQVMKRYFPRARGSAFTIRRKLSSVNLVLEERKKAGKVGAKVVAGLFKKTEKEVEPQSVDAKEASNKKPEENMGKKSQIGKTEEQQKMNKVANKRRLFNRKTGV